MRFIKFLFLGLVLLLLIVGSVSYWLFSSLTTANLHTKSEEVIIIEKGSTPPQIISQLAREGIISSELPLRLYLRSLGDATKLQAGEYKFASPISPLEVLKELEKGTVQTKRLTIPEGFTRFDIAKRLSEQLPTDPPMTEKEILELMSDTSMIKDIAPKALNLEGYLYPSTYELPPEARPEQAIKMMVDQFRKVWKPEWNERARRMGRTPNEIVTIASLIETESPLESERPIVASVIYNRIARNIPLGIDQTVVYVAKMQDRWDGTIHKSDIDADSPYNTRKYGGIPPGPISSVSVSAIEAALNPAETNYIFYVLNVQKNDGSHHFYASAAEFEKGKAEYQRWLEDQRRIKREQEAGQR
ncbi:MAG TPA: endolytic transglycosylase MltG [Pyrinomonadaceae bacterium]|nr:endolytic transglycosylase MltG [Pyrinomonadaceae bacterium]